MHELPSPTESMIVRLAVRRANRQRPSRPKQVRGLTNTIRCKLVESCTATLAGLRDAALICVGYDTLCRSSELAAMRIEHVTFGRDGFATVLIPRSKSDLAGDGRRETDLQSGPLFRALHLSRVSSEALATSSIRRLIKRATRRVGVEPTVAVALSGHSMRIGAPQDMMVSGFDTLAIMQAGGWKSANVVLRYVEKATTQELHRRRWRRLGHLDQIDEP